MTVVEPDSPIPPELRAEMLAVLETNERHGIVIARQGDSALADLLPRYSLTPVARGSYVLMREALAESFGTLDASAPSTNAGLADLSLRLDRYGYSTVVANHATLETPEASLSTEEREWLAGRHPTSSRMLDSLADRMTDPVEWFADVLRPGRTIKVLVDLTHVAPLHNGTSKVALSFVDYLARHVDRSRYEIVLAAHVDIEQLFDLGAFGFRVVRPDAVAERFHVGYVPTQVFTLDDLRLLDRWCVRFVVTDLDIISVRSIHLLAAKPERAAVFADAFTWADRVVAISDASRRDALDYFPELDDDRFVVIPQGYVSPDVTGEANVLPPNVTKSSYVLVVGNWLPHKAMDEAVSALASSGRSIVVLGGGPGLKGEDVYVVPSGGLSDGAVDQLVRDSALVVFPSLYEGFGLPIAEAAAHSRPIVLSETAVSREVADLFSGHTPAFFARSFSDLPATVDTALGASAPSATEPLRTIDDYSCEAWQLVAEVAEEPIDPQRLRRRTAYFRQIDSYVTTSVGGSVSARARRWLERRRSTSPRLYRAAYRLAWRAGRVRAR